MNVGIYLYHKQRWLDFLVPFEVCFLRVVFAKTIDLLMCF